MRTQQTIALTFAERRHFGELHRVPGIAKPKLRDKFGRTPLAKALHCAKRRRAVSSGYQVQEIHRPHAERMGQLDHIE